MEWRMAHLRSLTFARLMDVSERALWRTDSLPDYYRVPICQVLDDGTRYRRWEVSHARLMQQAARARQLLEQTTALRKTAIRMIHRRGLFDYLRAHDVRGAARERLFEVFYGPMDFSGAVLCEHRQYLLAASSGYCSEVLVDALHDREGARLIERYEDLYHDYFEAFGRFIAAEVIGDRELVSVLRPLMLGQRASADRLRAQILCNTRERRFEDTHDESAWRAHPGSRGRGATDRISVRWHGAA
jgi:hypothetical protein